MHHLIHSELASARADDVDRRLGNARLDAPPIRTRRRPLRTTARRLVLGLPRPVRSTP
jgi:hypothetical protein